MRARRIHRPGTCQCEETGAGAQMDSFIQLGRCSDVLRRARPGVSGVWLFVAFRGSGAVDGAGYTAGGKC